MKRKRKLQAASLAILERLDSLARELDTLPPKEAERRMQQAEAPLDRLALRNPIEAAEIYRRCAYFREPLERGEIYLGRGVIVRCELLAALNTPEKRAAFVARELRE